jgi:hypothetical protein
MAFPQTRLPAPRFGMSASRRFETYPRSSQLRKSRPSADGVGEGFGFTRSPARARPIPIVILPLQPGNQFDKRGKIPPDGKPEDSLMYTVVRSYFGKGAKELLDVLETNKADVEKTLRSVKGFVSYALVRSKDGGFSVTVCNDTKSVLMRALKRRGIGSRRTRPARAWPLRRYRRDQTSLT